MKTYNPVIFCCCLFLVLISQREPAYSLDVNPNPNDSVSFTIGEFINYENNKFDIELNTKYQQILESLKKYSKQTSYLAVAREQLITSQRSWIKFRDNDCKALASYLPDDPSNKSKHSECLMQRTMQRVKELDVWVKLLPQPATITEVDVVPQKLTVAFSIDKEFCSESAVMLEYDKTCRPYDGSIDRNNPKMCAPEDVNNINLYGKQTLAFQEIATNEYGYTYVYKSPFDNIYGDTIIYLNLFKGDRSSRTIETWLVETNALTQVLELPPGPLPYKMDDQKLLKRKEYPLRDTRASEFADLLNQGKKLSNDWSPIVNIEGKYYIVERDCVGEWNYGANYSCNGTIKINIKQLSPDRKVPIYCQFTKNAIN